MEINRSSMIKMLETELSSFNNSLARLTENGPSDVNEVTALVKAGERYNMLKDILNEYGSADDARVVNGFENAYTDSPQLLEARQLRNVEVGLEVKDGYGHTYKRNSKENDEWKSVPAGRIVNSYGMILPVTLKNKNINAKMI